MNRFVSLCFLSCSLLLGACTASSAANEESATGAEDELRAPQVTFFQRSPLSGRRMESFRAEVEGNLMGHAWTLNQGSTRGLQWETKDRSKLALDRFNRHAKLDLTLDDPEQASLDALKDWKGAKCPLQKAVPPRLKQRPVVVAPKKQAPPRKAVRAAPPKSPVQTVRPRSQPRDHGDDAVRELQRAFPSTAWPQ